MRFLLNEGITHRWFTGVTAAEIASRPDGSFVFVARTRVDGKVRGAYVSQGLGRISVDGEKKERLHKHDWTAYGYDSRGHAVGWACACGSLTSV